MADTRPAVVPTWATADTFSTGVGAGDDTKEDPSSLATEGWHPEDRPHAPHHNYQLHWLGRWATWTNDTALSTDGGTKVMSDVLELTEQGITFSALASCIVAATGGFFCAGTAEILSGCDFTFLTGSNLQVDSGAAITGSPTFSGTAWTWSSPQVNESQLANNGSGHMRYRHFNLNTTGAQTIGIANGDVFSVPSLTTPGLSLTLAAPPAGTGSPMLTIEAHQNFGSGFSASVTTAEGTYNMRADTGGIYCSSLTVIYYSGAWHTVHAVIVP